MAELAGRNREQVANLFGATDVVVIATLPEHIFYCSGYKSMGFDTDRLMRMAVVFDSRESILVGPKADLWGAAEAIGSELRYFSYGSFFFDDAEQKSMASVTDFASFGEALSAAVSRLAGGKRRVGFDHLDEDVAKILYEHGLAPVAATDGSRFFRDARATKHDLEITLLRQASALTESALLQALDDAKAGMSEYEFAARISSGIVAGGGVPGFIVVTAGERSALADAYPSARRLRPRDIVRIDVGCTFSGYWSDTARTAFVGEPTADALAVFTSTSVGQELGRSLVKPGMSTDLLFQETVSAVRQAGLPDYRRHHVGHGLGIEAHEYPTISASTRVPLAAGMVVCIEAPFYRPGWGGVMTEDTLLVTDTGAESLTNLARTPFIIKA